MQHIEGYDKKKSVGISVAVRFDSEKSLENLKTQLDETMKELGDKEVEIKFSTGAVQKELEKLGSQFETMRTKIDESFGNLDLTGLERLVGVINELSSVDSKLEINIFQKLKEDVAGVGEAATKAQEEFEKLAEEQEQVAKSAERMNEEIKLFRDSTGKVTQGIRTWVTETGEVKEEIVKASEAVKVLANQTKEAGETANTLYKRYESASIKAKELAERMEQAKNLGASKETLESLRELQNHYEGIAQAAKADIETLGLTNEKREQGIALREKGIELEKKYSSMVKQDVENKALANREAEKENQILRDRETTLKSLIEESLMYKKVLAEDDYDKNVDRDKFEDRSRSKRISGKIGGIRKYANNNNDVELKRILADYDNAVDEMDKYAKQYQKDKLAAENEEKYIAAENKVNELLSERLGLIKKIGTLSGEVKAQLSQKIVDLKNESVELIDEFKGLDKEKLLNISGDFDFEEKLFESNIQYKKIQGNQKKIIANLRTINKLATQNITTDSEEVRLKNEEAIKALEQEQVGLMKTITMEQLTQVVKIDNGLKLEREKLQILEDEKRTESARVAEIEKAQNLEKSYTELIKEDIKLQKQRNNAFSEEKKLQITEQLMELDKEKKAMLKDLTEERIDQLQVIEEQLNAEERVNVAESEAVAKAKEGKTLYKEIVQLQQERLRVENEIERTSSYDGKNLSRLKDSHQDLTSRIVDTRGAILNGGMFSETMEEENRAILANSKAMQTLTKTRTVNARKMEVVDEQLRAYAEELDKVAEKEGNAIRKTDQFAAATERLKLGLESDDLSIKQLAVSGMGNAMSELERKVNKTDEAMHRMFERWKDFVGYTAVNMATTGILGSFESAWENIKKVNEAYTEVHKVYDPNISGNNGWKATNWIQTANTMGQKYGFETADTLDAIYQAINYGYSNRGQALSMAKSSMILSNTGKISEEDASKDLISIMKGFYGDKKPLSTEYVDGKAESLIQSVIDKLSQGGMYYPITSGGIAEALKRGGSSMVGMGTNLEQAIQLIVAGNYSRQDPATVGNSMKSIYGSFTQLFTQDSKADIRKRKQLLGLTGNIYTNSQGELYNPYEILTKLSQQVNEGKFTRTQIGEIADLLGGKTQLGVVYSLLTHLTGVESKQKELNSNPQTQAAGSAERENAKYMESMIARLNQMKQITLDIWMKIINSKATMLILDTGVKALKTVNEIMGKIGAMPTLIAATFAILGVKDKSFFKHFGQGIYNRLQILKRILQGKEYKSLLGKNDTNQDLKDASRKQIAIVEERNKEMSELSEKGGREFSQAFAQGIRQDSMLVEEAAREQVDAVKSIFEEEKEFDENRPVSVFNKPKEEPEEPIINRYMINQEDVEETKVAIEEIDESIDTLEMSQKRLESQTDKLSYVYDTSLLKMKDATIKNNEEMIASNNALVASNDEVTASEKEKQIANSTGSPLKASERAVVEDGEGAVTRVATEDMTGGATEGIADLAIGGIASTGIGLGVAGALALGTWGIPKIYDLYKEHNQQQEEFLSEVQKEQTNGIATVNNYTNQIAELQKFEQQKEGQTLEKLNAQYQAGTLKGKGLQQYYTLMKKVAKIAPELVAFTGANGNPYLNMENGVKGLVDTLKQATVEQKQLNLSQQSQQELWKGYQTQKEKIQQEQKANEENQDNLDKLGHQEEDGSEKHTIYGVSYTAAASTLQTGSDLNNYTINQRQAWEQKYETTQKANTLAQQTFVQGDLKTYLNSSGNAVGISKFGKELMQKLAENSSISQVKSMAQWNEILNTMSFELTGKNKADKQKQLSQIVYSMEQFRNKLQSGTGNYSPEQIAKAESYYKNELVKFGMKEQNAEAMTSMSVFKPAQSFYQNLFNLVAKTGQVTKKNKSAILSSAQVTMDSLVGYFSTLGHKSALYKSKFDESVKQIFMNNKTLGRSIATAMGISTKTSLQEVVDTITKNPKLQKLAGIVMSEIASGKPNPQDIAKFAKEFSGAITTATIKTKQIVSEDGKSGKYTITLPIKVNSKGIETSAVNDGKAYAKKFHISSTTAGKIISALGLEQVAVKDGDTYKATAEQKAKAYGQVLHDKNVLDVAYKDGSLWAGKIRMTAKQVGQVLHALGVTSIAEKDGELYAGKVRITAKQAGKVLNDALASYTGSKDGSLYASSANKTAVASGKVQADLSQIRQSASGAAQYWRITFESIIRGVSEGASWLEKHLNTPIRSDFMALPAINLGNTKISGHQTLAQNLMTALQPKVHSAFASAKGGVSASVGGKGGKGASGAVGMGAVSFATTGISSSNTGSDMVASGVEELDSLGGLVPSNSVFAQAGANAGYSYVASYSQIMNSLLDEEATQYQRLQNINETYFDTDTNNLKLSIDLNERLKNTITDIGNAISHNQVLQTETENGYKTIDLMKEELSLLDQKKQANEALENSYEKQLSLMKNSLENQGFQFNSNGDITNALAKLQGLENWVNKMPDEIQQSKTTEHYTKTPYTYYKYGKGSETETPYHYYKNVGGHYVTKSDTYWDYKLGKDVTKTWKEWVAGTEKEIKGSYKRYQEGKKTLETGYKYSKTPETTTDEVTNQAKQKASQTVQNLQNMVTAYNNMLHQTLPQTTSAIDQINQQVEQMYNGMLQTASTVESQITQVIQKQISERKQVIQNSANEETQALQKQLTAMQQQQSTDSYKQGLAQQQAQLATLQNQIDNAQLDHSLVGQANLSALQKQYDALQKQINQTIQSHNEQQAQQTIQNKINSINQNAQDQQNAIDKTWNTAKIAETVKNAILNGSFTDVNGQIVKTKTTWVEFANEFSNGLGVMGNKMKDDFIKQLEEAQKIMENINSINSKMGYYNTSSATPAWVVPQQSSSFMAVSPMGFDHRNARVVVSNNNHQINFNSPLVNVQGSVSNVNDLHKFTKDLEQKVTKHIVKNLRNTGAI